MNSKSEYPKLFTEKDIVCVCHVQSDWAISTATPAKELCPKCQKWLKYFQDRYWDLVTKQGVDNDELHTEPMI